VQDRFNQVLSIKCKLGGPDMSRRQEQASGKANNSWLTRIRLAGTTDQKHRALMKRDPQTFLFVLMRILRLVIRVKKQLIASWRAIGGGNKWQLLDTDQTRRNYR
jgi:hypothetical protein